MAAQAPELVVNDMRHHVLPLYFSRPIGRFDYVFAKLAALSIALLGLTLLPVLVLFGGRVLAAEDLVAALGDEIGALPGIVGSGVLHAVVLASLGLAICSLAARRAYAAGAVLAVFLIGSVVSGTFQGQPDPRPRVGCAVRESAGHPDGARESLFGGSVTESPVAAANLPLYIYGVATAILLARLAGDPGHPLSASDDVSELSLSGVSRWYGNVVAVNDVTFEVGAGITGLLGPNGAGKTTLLHMMAGFLRRRLARCGSTGRRPGGTPRSIGVIGFVPEREAVYSFLTGRHSCARSARLSGVSRRRRGGRPRHRHGPAARRRKPGDRRLLEGHAPAGQGRRRAGARSADPDPGRAVQRDGSAPAPR